MIKKEEFFYDSRDGKTKIHAVKWILEQCLAENSKPVCIFQIVHGMAEYVERYEDFATFLAERGFLVVGEDHLGHGDTIGKDGTPGYFCKTDAATVLVRDIHRLKKMMQEQYPGVPYLLLGHSMGSFIVRNYLCRYGSGIEGAIIMGTGMQSKALLTLTKVLARVIGLCGGEKKPSPLMDKLGFGTYTKQIKEPKSNMDWLSREESVVQAYLADPLCGFVFTANGFHTMGELISRLHRIGYLEKMPKTLPILLTAGAQDPVGEYGRAVKKVYEQYQQLGMQKVTMKLYEGCRHELLNETDRETIYEDIYQWAMKIVQNGNRGEPYV